MVPVNDKRVFGAKLNMVFIKLPMLTKPSMYNSIDSNTARATNIARWLFFINLIPTIIACGIVLITFDQLERNHFGNTYDWIVLSLMLLGIAMQYIYYRQMTNTYHALNPAGWVCSIIINTIFIVSHVVSSFRTLSSAGLIIVYPIVFLVFSVKVLRLLRHSEPSAIS